MNNTTLKGINYLLIIVLIASGVGIGFVWYASRFNPEVNDYIIVQVQSKPSVLGEQIVEKDADHEIIEETIVKEQESITRSASQEIVQHDAEPETIPEPEPKPAPTSVPQAELQEDSSLKIARCESERDADYSYVINLIDQLIDEAVEEINAEAAAFIEEQQALYDACLIERPEELKEFDNDYSPEYLCSFYLRNIEAKLDITEQLVEEAKATLEDSLPQLKANVDKEYSQCLKD